jgi:hypothetical protein
MGSIPDVCKVVLDWSNPSSTNLWSHSLVKERFPSMGQKKKLQGLQRMALSQIAHVRPSTPSAGLEVMYGVPPLDLFIQNCAQNAAIRVKPDITWQPQAKAKARVAHGRHLQHQFPAGLWQADTDEITHQKVWEKNYTVHLPTNEIDMLPS